LYRAVFIVLIAVVALFTAGVIIFQPEMHKSAFIYDSSFEITEPKTVVETVKVMPDKAVREPQTQTVKKVETVSTVKKQESAPKQTVKTVNKTAVKVNKTVKTAEKPVSTTTVTKQTVQKPAQTTTVKKTENTVQPVSKTVTTPVQVKTVTQTEQERQELILWNKWRSNLQNQIMSDTKLPIVPVGTIFKFTFNVDKYGRISDLHTWSTNPSYTPYAIQYIAPVIRSYQGRSILNFPSGSNRISTTVEGGWKISNTSKYSTSADYNDTEKVVK